MDMTKKFLIFLLMVLFLLTALAPAGAAVLIQCPGDLNGDAVPDPFLFKNNGDPSNKINPDFDPNVKCMHLGAGDGFVTMADGHLQYIFSFNDLTGIKDDPATAYDERMDAGMLAATFPAPTITVNEGDKFYLSLTNVGMMMRPDLFDPHTVHWHGFPNASSIFDGVPDASISINMGFTFTYFYNVVEPGTYMYHCHVEATEHMQMGMLGNLYVLPGQDRLPNGTVLGAYVHTNTGDADVAPFGDFPGPGDVDLNGNGRFDEGTHDRYAYNDGDGSTRYDVDYPIQIGSFDGNFHDEHLAVQPLPFYYMRDDYPMLNGRGYPDTINPASLAVPMDGGSPANATMNFPAGHPSQNVSALITASPGQRVLLRISNLNVTRFYTVASPNIPMKIVGFSARLLRSPSGNDLYYTTNSVTVGGGEALDAILEIPATAPIGATYFLYTTNLNYLNNGIDDFGGMMTEIRIQ